MDVCMEGLKRKCNSGGPNKRTDTSLINFWLGTASLRSYPFVSREAGEHLGL